MGYLECQALSPASRVVVRGAFEARVRLGAMSSSENARSRTAAGYRDGGSGGSLFSAVALLREREEAAKRKEASTSPDERERAEADAKRMKGWEEGISRMERAAKEREATALREKPLRDKERGYLEAVRGMTVKAATALFDGKTLDHLDAHAVEYHRSRWNEAARGGRSALRALEMAPYPSLLSPQLRDFVIHRADEEARRQAALAAAGATATATAGARTYARVMFLYRHAAADVIHLACLRAIAVHKRPEGFGADGTPSAAAISTIDDIRLYLRHV